MFCPITGTWDATNLHKLTLRNLNPTPREALTTTECVSPKLYHNVETYDIVESFDGHQFEVVQKMSPAACVLEEMASQWEYFPDFDLPHRKDIEQVFVDCIRDVISQTHGLTVETGRCWSA